MPVVNSSMLVAGLNGTTFVGIVALSSIVVMVVSIPMMLFFCTACAKHNKDDKHRNEVRSPSSPQNKKRSMSPSVPMSPTLDERFGSMPPTKAFEGRKNNPLFNQSFSTTSNELTGKHNGIHGINGNPKRNSNEIEAGFGFPSDDEVTQHHKTQNSSLKDTEFVARDEIVQRAETAWVKPKKSKKKKSSQNEPKSDNQEKRESFSGFGDLNPIETSKASTPMPSNQSDGYLSVITGSGQQDTSEQSVSTKEKSQPERVKSLKEKRDAARAEKLAKLKLARSRKNEDFQKGLEDALAIIDNLVE